MGQVFGTGLTSGLVSARPAAPAGSAATASIAPRNGFVGDALHRVDMRVQRRFRAGHVSFDGMFEVFNVFNRANYGSFVANEASPLFGRPTQNSNLAYAPRMMQFGFRVAF